MIIFKKLKKRNNTNLLIYIHSTYFPNKISEISSRNALTVDALKGLGSLMRLH